MSHETPYPDDSTLEAWLAGRLSPAEAVEIERLLEAGGNPVEEVGDIDPVALRAVPHACHIRKQAYHGEASPLRETQFLRAQVAPEGAGDMIGRYRLIERIGQGGFGDVWRAQQLEPITRHVALKVIKLGMDTEEVLTRFDAERQALARMDHPNIATVLDAGATNSGRPFFVMELVDGAPIDTFCRVGRPARRAPD